MKRLALFALVTAVAVSGCVGPARTYPPYKADAVATAQQANAAAQTALLAVETGAEGRAFATYLSITLRDAEDAAASVQSQFDSEQPPNRAGDRLRAKLDGMLQVAVSTLSDLRIHARRGEVDYLKSLAEPLKKTSSGLQAFVAANQP